MYDLLAPIAGQADNDAIEDYYMQLGELTESQYKEIIQKEFIPYYNTLNKQIFDTMRSLLRQALCDTEYNNYERDFDCVLPPFDPPENPRDFFVWLDEAIQNMNGPEQ